MRLKIHQFLKQFGLRQAGELQRPRLHAIKKLELPHETVFQFFADSGAARGPSQTDPLFSRSKSKVFVQHVTTLEAMAGNPRRTSLVPATLISDFRRQNRFFKPHRKDEAIRLNTQNILVMNYNLLSPLWQYPATFKSSWYRWCNEQETFWTNVAQAHERFGWNQFIEIHIPESIPTFAQFKQLTKMQTQELLNTFRTTAALNVFDFYRWLGDERDSSYMSLVPEAAYEKINLLFRVGGSFFVLNLGQLEAWRKDPQLTEEVVAQESFIDELGVESFYTPDILQRRVISLLTTLVEYNNGNSSLVEKELEAGSTHPNLADLDEPDDADVTDEEDEEDDTAQADTAVEPDSGETEDDDVITDDTGPLVGLLDLGELEVTYTPPPQSELIATSLVIEKDPMDTAPIQDAKTLKVEVSASKPLNEAPDGQDDPMVGTIANKAYNLYQVGLISPRTYELAVEEAKSYTHLPDPFGSGVTIAEAMDWKPDDLDLPANSTFPDKTTVLDKSMLSSKLKAMTRKYVKDLLPKNILQAVMSVQKLGCSVTGYEIETVQDIMNHYQIHTVQLKPLRGRASTVRFRVPVIDKDGRFRSNGITYRQRLQRVDIPIRKVNPKRVALTSYTSKVFVERSDLAENNYDRWLIRQVMARALDSEDVTVTNPKYAELDQSQYHLPRVYSTLGSTFRSFVNHKSVFYFDYVNRETYFKDTHGLAIADHETNGMVLVGVHAGAPVLLDQKGMFYHKDPAGSLEPMGTIVEILGLSLSKAPLEAVTVSVANKALPLGFLLAYNVGLSKLLATLKVQYVRHPRGTRVALEHDDYTLTFADDILVFNRNDYPSMLVLAGLRKYHKVLRNYSVWDFDRRDVYFRLLEESGLSARYARNIENMFQGWVDPITMKLLEEMNEPTTFEGLLYRALELLQDDWSPSEVDGAYMRYRGYERIAGAVFGELNRAVRLFNDRQGSSDLQVSMDPHAVWRKITSDPTVATIEDSNPIANLREQEAMTYRGDGGRGSTSMVSRTRVYTEADLGVVSESTVDSGDVGVIAYLTPDANFVNMLGVTRPYDEKKDGKGKLLSSAALLAVASTNDD